MNEVHDLEVQPELLTLKLAENHSITTKGSIRLRVCIQGREVTVPLHIVDNLAYSIILGCDFLRKEKIILRFDTAQHEIQSIDILNDSKDDQGKVYLYQDITIPAHHQCCVECCITPSIGIDTTLLTQRGLLIAHSLIDSRTKQLTTMIANISNSTVQLRKFEQIAHLEVEIEEQIKDRSDQQELEMTKNGR
jgi:hypothetical protein